MQRYHFEVKAPRNQPCDESILQLSKNFPPLEPKSSTLGTKKFQKGNYFWNSYVLRSQHDTNSASDYFALATHGFRKAKMSVGVADMWADLRSFVQEV